MPTLFFTGYPGFLGSALLPRVLARSAESTAVCLVQPKFAALARERARAAPACEGGDAPIEAHAETMAIARAPGVWRQLLLFFVMLPFWTSFLIRVYAWIAILQPSGLLNRLLLAAGAIDAPLPLLYNPRRRSAPAALVDRAILARCGWLAERAHQFRNEPFQLFRTADRHFHRCA